MDKIRLTIFALCASSLYVGQARAGDATLVCQLRKLEAQAAAERCLVSQEAAALKGKPNDSAACENRLATELARIDKEEAKTPCRYRDNGDGTVGDLNTGLTWEKKTTDGSVHDVKNTYRWANVGDSAPDGPAFTSFLATLDNSVSTDGSSVSGCFANQCDWRLPTVVELHGIVDLNANGCGSVSPCIDPTFGYTDTGDYWTATSNAEDATIVFQVVFVDGRLDEIHKGDLVSEAFVRAVRTGL